MGIEQLSNAIDVVREIQPEKKKRLVSLDEYNIQSIHSAALANDTTPAATNIITWQPDYWVIVARLTSGYINVYPGAQRGGAFSVRLNSGTAIIPLHVDTLTVETVGATGFYSLYAVNNLDGFDISS